MKQLQRVVLFGLVPNLLLREVPETPSTGHVCINKFILPKDCLIVAQELFVVFAR